jgi:hypothetical protein
MTHYSAKLLELKYRIIEQVRPGNFEVLKPAPDFKPDEKPKTELEKLKAEYAGLFGKAPHHALKEPKLRELIDAKKAESGQ